MGSGSSDGESDVSGVSGEGTDSVEHSTSALQRSERPIVVLDSGPVIGQPRSNSKRTASLLSYVILVVGVLALAGSAVKTNYVAYTPGSASDLVPLVKITGAKNYPPNGSFLLATVGLTDRLTVWQYVSAAVNPDVDLKRYADLFPAGRETELKRNEVLMDDSKTLATLAALRALGRDGEGSGVAVKGVEPKSPADGRLSEGDVIETINGTKICVAGDLRSGILDTPKGGKVTLGVRSANGKMRDESIIPVTSQNFRIIGVLVETVKCALPITVTIDTARVGGPSAGLSMTLAILDRLTEGELTGGLVIATTGTIESDGSVGDVGGVKQKTAGVRSAGAKLFLVPPGEVEEAKSRAGNLPVVGVRNLDEALAALRRYGGQPLPSLRATP